MSIPRHVHSGRRADRRSPREALAAAGLPSSGRAPASLVVVAAAGPGRSPCRTASSPTWLPEKWAFWAKRKGRASPCKPSRLTLFYERRLGYLGSYFNYKIWLVQMFEVYIQCFGKVTKIHVVDSFFLDRGGEVWSLCTVLAIMLNVAYPAILLGAKTARLQRDLVFVLDTTLDAASTQSFLYGSCSWGAVTSL